MVHSFIPDEYELIIGLIGLLVGIPAIVWYLNKIHLITVRNPFKKTTYGKRFDREL